MDLARTGPIEAPGRFGSRLGAIALVLVASAGLAVVAAAVPVEPAFGQAQPSWPSIQGGPAHSGALPAGPAGTALSPPLREAWRTDQPGDRRLSTPAVDSGLAIAVGREVVLGLDPATGSTLWTVPKGDGPIAAPALEPGDGGSPPIGVYAEGQGADSGVVGLDLDTRERLWRVALGGAAQTGVVIDDGAAFVGSRDGFVYRIDLATGAVDWRANVGGPVSSGVAVAAGRVFATGASTSTGESFFSAFDVSTGEKLWTYRPSRYATGGSSPTVAGDVVYAGFGDAFVRAFDAATGALRWETRVRGPFDGLSSPAFSAGSLYVADFYGGLYRLDGASGRVIWDYQFAGFVLWGSPLVAGQYVYLGLEEGNEGVLVAVRLSDGHQVWQHRMGGGPVGALSPAGDRLLVPSLGSGGGIRGFATDPAGRLLDIPSPTELQPGAALLNFAAALAIVGLPLLALGRFVLHGPVPPGSGRLGVRRRSEPRVH